MGSILGFRPHGPIFGKPMHKNKGNKSQYLPIEGCRDFIIRIRLVGVFRFLLPPPSSLLFFPFSSSLQPIFLLFPLFSLFSFFIVISMEERVFSSSRIHWIMWFDFLRLCCSISMQYMFSCSFLLILDYRLSLNGIEILIHDRDID